MEDNGFAEIEKMAGELLQNGNGVSVSPAPAPYRNGVTAATAATATEIPLDSKDVKYDDEDTSHGLDQGQGGAKCCYRVKIVYLLLFMVMVSVWGLLSLPIVFYHIPVEVQVSNASNTTGIPANGECSSASSYPSVPTGGVCRGELKEILELANCGINEVPLVLSNGEVMASQAILGLNSLSPSPECREAVVPFLCLLLFGLCGSTSGLPLQPTSAECLDIRDRLCVAEWRLVAGLGLIDLPTCEDLPDEQVSCLASGDSMTNESDSTELEDTNTTDFTAAAPGSPTVQPLECREGFFREDPSSICLPSCYSWLQYSRVTSITTDVIVFLTAAIGLIAAVVVLIISYLRRKRMCTFPSIFVVYITVDLLVLGIFVIINYIDRPSLFCNSMNLLEALSNVTPFCVISGMVFTYTLVQLTVWWLLHTTFLFWKIQFPFHSRSFEVTHRIKYIHIVCIIVGFLFPLVPIVTSMADFAVDLKSSNSSQSFVDGGMGFTITRFPPILCTGSDRDAVFYSVVFPINLALAIGCTLLISTLWTIHKRHGLLRNNSFKSSLKNSFKIGTAERKLLIVFCYYVLLASVSLMAFTISTRNLTHLSQLVGQYFSCEINGHDASNPCSRSEFEALSNAGLAGSAYILLGLFPIVNLLYAVNIQELKAVCRCFRKRSSHLQSTATTSGMHSSTMKKA